MKFHKLVLLAALSSLVAFVGTASAGTATSPTGTTYTSTIKATAGALNFTGSFVKVECSSSTMEGKIEKHGAGVTAGGNLGFLTFNGCNYEVTVEDPGSFAVDGITGSENGTLTWTGVRFSIHTSVGTCIFETLATHIGTITAGAGAKLDIASAKIPRVGGNFLCGSSYTWNGSYTFSTPSSLYFD